MMRILTALIVIFLARCVHLHYTDRTFVKLIIDEFKDIPYKIHLCELGVKKISMFLYTREIPEGKNIGVEECCDKIDPSEPIVFEVHGFNDYANRSLMFELSSKFVKKNYTVFALDWSDAACRHGVPLLKFLAYPFAVHNVREIGHLMAKYVIALNDKCNIPFKNITLIGHSLGAHVCGFAAKEINKSGRGIVHRIIGADPARPLFMLNKCERRLCKSDAEHVIAVHTSSLGREIGGLDLNFHNGRMQPGCEILRLNLPEILRLNVDVTCSHDRSFVYLASMLMNNCGFPAVPASSKSTYPSPHTTNCMIVDRKEIYESEKIREGEKYDVFVSSEYPYCTHQTFNCQL